MSEKTKLGLALLGVAVAMGLLADGLLRVGPPGLNVGLWVALLAIGLGGVAVWRRIPMAGGGRWLVAPGLAFAFAFAWRDSPLLGMANLLALAVCVTLATARARTGRIAVASLWDYALAAFRTFVNAQAGTFMLMADDVRWDELPRGGWTRGTMAVVRGLALALPILLVFGALFAAADAVFSALAADLFDWELNQVVGHLLWISLGTVVVGGLARQTLLGGYDPQLPQPPRGRVGWVSLGMVETGTVLGALDLLFLAFVLVQFRYFFGGAELVQATAGLTYAEYARRGFFELVAVAALALPLLLFADWLLKRDGPRDERLFRVLAGALVAMIFLVLGSALARMRLYQDEYGMTELRLYTTAFMAWLAVVFAWFGVTVLRGRRERFAFGAMVSGLALVAGLNLLNPDGYIVATNVDRLRAGKTLDAPYAASLSGDAAPEIVGALANIPEAERQETAEALLRGWSGTPDQDLRTWNWGRQQAWKAVHENEETLRQMAGGGIRPR